MSTQLLLWPISEEEKIFIETKELKKDVNQLRKSMFARHGEFMKVLSDLQSQIDELKNDKALIEKNHE